MSTQRKSLVKFWGPGNPDYDQLIADQQDAWVRTHRGMFKKREFDIAKKMVADFIEGKEDWKQAWRKKIK